MANYPTQPYSTTTFTLPTAGVGGSYYDTPFQVPVYPNSPNNLLTWRMLDTWNDINISYAATQGIAAGLVWATLTYLLALTPHPKRKTAFHSCMLTGLVFLLIHLMIDIVSSLTPGLQTLSAYNSLTFDTVDCVWTDTVVATFATSQVTAWFAFTFASICLWLQAKGLMTGFRVRNLVLYRTILSYLTLTSVCALAAAMTYSINQIISLGLPPEDVSSSAYMRYNAKVAYLACYAICVGSYSLVSMVSVANIVWRRPYAVMTGNSAYSTALNLLGLLCAQSFVIPCKLLRVANIFNPDTHTESCAVVFSILVIVPKEMGMMRPEIMLLPSVYMILPLGSLFMTVNSNHATGAENVETAISRYPKFPRANCNCDCHLNRNHNRDGCMKAAYADSDKTLISGQPGPLLSPYTIDGAHIEQQLSSIDAMDCDPSGETRRCYTGKAEAMLADKACREKEVVIST
jgi:hypothetical protein